MLTALAATVLTLSPVRAALAQPTYIKASNTGSFNYFGQSVAVSGDTMVVGADGENSGSAGVNGPQTNCCAYGSGAAYVFVRSGTSWIQQAYLKASNPEGQHDGIFADRFGYSVAVAGDTVVVGAPQESSNATGVNGDQTNNNAVLSGAAYVFVRNGTNWSQQAYLKASNTEWYDQLGVAVAVSGDTVVIGAYGEASGATGVNGDQVDNSAPGSGAAYVFVRSGTNWTQQAYLKASNTRTNAASSFGYAVAAAGDTVVVGAFGESSNATGVNGNQSDESAFRSGAAYVFTRTGTNWIQEAYLKASNTDPDDYFGGSVAVSGDTVVVGAYGESSIAPCVDGNQSDNGAPYTGAAYVFARNGTNWTQQSYLKASNPDIYDSFGRSVSVSGDTVIVGADAEDSNATGANGNPNDNSLPASGAAYAFVRTGANWNQKAYLKATNPGINDSFGRAVAVSGDTAVIGAYFEDSYATGVNGDQSNNSFPDAGAAYFYDLASVIIQAPEIVVEQPSGNGLGDGASAVYFGAAQLGSVSERTFAVRNFGTVDLTGLGISITGPHASDFTVTAYPTAPVSGPCGSTTFTVTFSPGTTSERSADLHLTSNDGDESPFDIALTGTGITPVGIAQQAYVKSSNSGAGGNFGFSVALSGDTMVVGTRFRGSVYVFVRNGPNWTQQAHLRAPYAEFNTASFGYSVAVSGDTLVVGAIGDSSNATGVNGSPTNNLVPSSGAAYVFVRSGTNWTQQAYLKASNTGTGDVFGASVAVSGDTVVVGAYGERSNATGINGNQNDNSIPYAGAAYVFVRHGTNWTQQAYLKASHAGTSESGLGYYFGNSVSMDGETVVVGAFGESSDATGVNGNPNNDGLLFSGAAFVFVRIGTNWSQQAYLKSFYTSFSGKFGDAVAVSGNTIVAGAFGTDAAYVFTRTGTNWSEQAFLTAAPLGRKNFGDAVAIAGDTIVVGAPFENSNTIGVNGDQTDQSATYSGAAYVFVRYGSKWFQQAYLKASNTDPEDAFGWSVAVFGDTVAVAAIQESSNATAVNGNQADNSAQLSGAVYVFTRFGLGPRLGIARDGTSSYFLRFHGAPDSTYHLQRAPAVTGPWTAIATNTTPASGIVEFHDASPLTGQAFYRTFQP